MSIPLPVLLQTRRFLPLFVTQTLGALIDNLLKNAVVVLVLFRSAEAGPALVALAGGLFILPYALFSATAGQFADRHDKARLIRLTKLAEVAIMGLAALGFVTGSLPVLLAVLFGLGTQATFFSPLKYGILPDHLREDELVAGNGLIEAGTFLGILAGTIAGGALILIENGAALTSALGLGLSLAGLAAAWFVPPARPAAPDLVVRWNFIRETAALVRAARSVRGIWLSILGLSWFWTVGATLLTEFPILAKQTLGAPDASVMTLLLTVFAVGVGIGSILCSRMLHGEVTARHVPFAALGISLFTWDFATTAASAGPLGGVGAILGSVDGIRMLADLLLLAACGGIYSVPLYAIIQDRSAATIRSRMIACNNVMNAAFMVAGAGAAAGLAAAGLSATQILEITAAVNLAVAGWIVRILPQETFRALFRWYFRAFHAADVTGSENLDRAGERSVVVVNHLSFLDGCFIAAYLRGSPLFAVDTEQARRFWYLSLIVDLLPIDPTSPMATKTMIKAVREGRQLVIFPEGRISLTGALMKIYSGPAIIADKAGASIIPVRLDGPQFHKTARTGGRMRHRWFPPFRMTILPPVRPELSGDLRGKPRRAALTRILEDIMADAAFRPEAARRPLFAALLDARTRYDDGRAVIADAQRTEASYGRIVLGATVLGRKLATLAVAGEHVGVLLPNSVGVVVTFFGLQAYRRIPAMLNFSAGAESVLAAIRSAEIRTVVTSRAFVEKGKLGPLIEALSAHVRIAWLEDVRRSIGLADKLAGKLRALAPHRLPGASADPGDAAVVLFTSGSEGTPKGVVLSHANLLSNCAQVAAVVDLNPTDRFFNALPVFHSFGLTGGTLLPLMLGIRTFLYPSPLHYKLVPELAYAEQSTVLFGTDSFLGGYARMGSPQDFQSMRFIVGGAERVKDETRRVYWEKFQKPIYEGYGATECAPVLAINTPAQFRSGTVGRLLPGIDYRLQAVPGIDAGGLLQVKGPNVMVGYLKADAPGRLQPPPDGWYDTGDIVSVDADRFVTIKGRAKRFAKIAGEMVSLAAAEALTADLWPDARHAVVSLPDPRKGEQLVLVTTQTDAAARALLAHARSRGVPEIMVPRSILAVADLPLLGTGKIDLPGVQKLAAAGVASPREDMVAE